MGSLLACATVVAVAVMASACSEGSDSDDRTGVTLPTSLTAPTTMPGSDTTTADITAEPAPASTTTAAPGTPDGDPRIIGARAELSQPACASGGVAVTVTVEMAPEAPARVLSAIVDGAPTVAAAVNPTGAITIFEVPSVACDGGLHTILVIASAGEDRSSRAAAVVRTPAPG